jgi:hypothetical protein
MRYFLCTLIISLSFCQPAFSAQIRLAWDPNDEPDLAGYEVFYGDAPWNFGKSKKLEKMTTYTLTDLTQGQTYCIALKAYTSENESGFSNQVCGVAHDETYGEWVFDITGMDKGGAVLQFDDIQQTFWGYGISNKLTIFGMSGSYTYEVKKGTLRGTYEIHDFHGSQSTLGTGNLNGRLDSKRTTMTLQLSAFSMKGPLFLRDPLNPQYPSLPEDWSFEITGSLKAGIDPVKMEPYAVDGELQSHLFKFYGPEASPNPGTLDLLGIFLLTPKNKVYGVYEMSGSLPDEGYLSGSMNGTLTQFNAKSVSDNKKRYTFKGQSKP